MSFCQVLDKVLLPLLDFGLNRSIRELFGVLHVYFVIYWYRSCNDPVSLVPSLRYFPFLLGSLFNVSRGTTYVIISLLDFSM